MNKNKTLLLVVSCLLATGCAGRHYDRTQVGVLEGDLIVEWRKPNSFVFIPSETEPLKYTRASNGDVIQPDRIWTDGGSIPRQFWVFKNFSPWGYGPAFIIHDWLFHMQDCDLDGNDDYDIKTAAVIMSEVMKSLMEDPEFDYGSETSMYLMYKAVQTEPAQRAWSDGECRPVLEAPLTKPDRVFGLSFD